MRATDRFPVLDGPELWTQSTGEDEPPSIEGWAVTYRDSPNFSGRILVPGAFTDSLKRRPTRRKPLPMGFEHSSYTGTNVIGSWSQATDTKDGLKLAGGKILPTTAGRDAQLLVDEGVITGLSVGFIPTDVRMGLPGDKHDFSTPFGKRSYRVDDDIVLFITEGELLETSLVSAPADDEARMSHLQSVTAKASKAMPGLKPEAGWEQVAYSMALLMGGRGAGHEFRDLGELERAGLYQQLAERYVEFGKTPPEYDPEPDYRTVAFEHDERDVFQQRYVAKTMATLIAGLEGLPPGSLSQEAQERAEQLSELLHERQLAWLDSARPNGSDSVAFLAAELRSAIELTGGGHG